VSPFCFPPLEAARASFRRKAHRWEVTQGTEVTEGIEGIEDAEGAEGASSLPVTSEFGDGAPPDDTGGRTARW